MFGKNKILGVDNNEQLGVVNIFLTIQGEGPFCGMPAIFIRLGGCNLACKFCDTEFDEFSYMTNEAILEQCQQKRMSANFKLLVVITGGEPMRQNINRLCDLLIQDNFMVQIETNGTINRKLDPEVKIVYSPKPSLNGYSTPDSLWLERVEAIKILISTTHKYYDDIPLWLYKSLQNQPIDLADKVILQPIDEYSQEKNAANLRLAIHLSHKYNLRLGIQLHKIIGVE